MTKSRLLSLIKEARMALERHEMVEKEKQLFEDLEDAEKSLLFSLRSAKGAVWEMGTDGRPVLWVGHWVVSAYQEPNGKNEGRWNAYVRARRPRHIAAETEELAKDMGRDIAIKLWDVI